MNKAEDIKNGADSIRRNRTYAAARMREELAMLYSREVALQNILGKTTPQLLVKRENLSASVSSRRSEGDKLLADQLVSQFRPSGYSVRFPPDSVIHLTNDTDDAPMTAAKTRFVACDGDASILARSWKPPTLPPHTYTSVRSACQSTISAIAGALDTNPATGPKRMRSEV